MKAVPWGGTPDGSASLPQFAQRTYRESRRAERYAAASPMMKSVFFESENLTQQCSGGAPATSTRAASIRFAISTFCSSLRPSNQ